MGLCRTNLLLRGEDNMQTKDEFMKEVKEEMGDDFPYVIGGLDNEYYSMVEKEIKSGRTISKAVYDSLSAGQKFHFNKHYNYRNDKVHE